MEKIMLIKIVKSEQYDSLIITYAKANSVSTEKYKGLSEYLQWSKKLEIFEEFTKEDFGKIYDAELGYSEPDYQGKCKQIINKLMIHGKVITFK